MAKVELMELYEAVNSLELKKVSSILEEKSLNLDEGINICGTRMTLLHLAVGLECTEIVRVLLEHNADANSKNGDDGLSPLHLSVHYNNLEIFELLLKAGGDPNITDDERNETCMDIIIKMNDEDLKQQFIEAVVASISVTSTSVQCKPIEESQLVGKCYSTSADQKDTLWFSTTQGISDESTYAFSSDATYSIHNPFSPPPSMLAVRTNSSVTDSDTFISAKAEESQCSGNSSCMCCSNSAPTPGLSELELERVRKAALARGLPVLPSTISVLSKFVNTETEVITLSPPPPTSTQGYSMELDLALRNIECINQWQNLQVDFLQQLKTPARASKSFFNYILLDPNVLKKTNFSGNQLKTGLLQNPEKFNVLVKSIFYIGKGTANRPFQHLTDAKIRFTTKKNLRLADNTKLDKVVSIWEKGQGVIVLTLFHSSTEFEANANEAAMIDAIGLTCPHLTNLRKGTYLNTPAGSWSQKAKNQFGTCLLHKAYCMFVVSGNSVKLFFPQDC